MVLSDFDTNKALRPTTSDQAKSSSISNKRYELHYAAQVHSLPPRTRVLTSNPLEPSP